mmetsp:Transcript_51010/g.101364  ORF Transcript_51010/g.101364 Transcript_51010/m.101364 type:complete len:229 (+) Transcript_51010:212-898(+)
MCTLRPAGDEDRRGDGVFPKSLPVVVTDTAGHNHGESAPVAVLRSRPVAICCGDACTPAKGTRYERSTGEPTMGLLGSATCAEDGVAFVANCGRVQEGYTLAEPPTGRVVKAGEGDAAPLETHLLSIGVALNCWTGGRQTAAGKKDATARPGELLQAGCALRFKLPVLEEPLLPVRNATVSMLGPPARVTSDETLNPPPCPLHGGIWPWRLRGVVKLVQPEVVNCAPR